MYKVSVINQARMTSTRLPGKVLKKLPDEKTMLELQIERLKRATLVDNIIIATTINKDDDVIVELAEKMGVSVYRGSEDNVLERFFLAHEENPSEYVIRVTSDCPFIDPEVIDESIRQFLSSGCDYGSNSDAYPNGMNVEIFKSSMLKEAYTESTKPYEKEHVTPFFYTHPDRYRLMQVTSERVYPRYRLTLDTPEDYLLIQKVYQGISSKQNFTMGDIDNFLKENSELLKINENIIQKKYTD